MQSKWLNLQANVSLTTVILISAILISSGLVVIITGIDLSLSSQSYLNHRTAQIHSTSCLEESLNRLNSNPAYTGSINLTLSGGSCQSQVSIDGANPNLRNVVVTSSAGEYSYAITKKVNISVSPYTVTN